MIDGARLVAPGDSTALGLGVGRHDGAGARVIVDLEVAPEHSGDLRKAHLHRVHVEMLTDDAGRGDKYLLSRAVENRGDHVGRLVGIAQARLAGRGVGVLGVGDKGARIARLSDMLTVDRDGGGAEDVGGEHTGNGGGLVGHDHGQVETVGIGLETCMHGAGLEPGGHAHAALHMRTGETRACGHLQGLVLHGQSLVEVPLNKVRVIYFLVSGTAFRIQISCGIHTTAA